ncbi:hypothetical protein [Staphylococcus epidermidis]|uniref:hypothetical protein n=1 Tax=Staphylococcus epidermidis TaxID=1282 RepID=UPI001F35E404|nr:hypothetical protein [Staphylococcus epidermidis]MCG2339351.1 hypothetical protein [Staphylococcus epidermidis]UJA40364.1 hypothetical protein KB229_08430 [Staphylococcus epidermidis]UXR95969.1 hypothetical protein MUA98_08270 [Staphylococcus epidermidis]
MIYFTILLETSILIFINDMSRYVNDKIETIIDTEFNEIEYHCDAIYYIIVKYC